VFRKKADKLRRELEIASSRFVISGVTIPSFQPVRNGHFGRYGSIFRVTITSCTRFRPTTTGKL